MPRFCLSLAAPDHQVARMKILNLFAALALSTLMWFGVTAAVHDLWHDVRIAEAQAAVHRS
jgi:hypothetical protein